MLKPLICLIANIIAAPKIQTSFSVFPSHCDKLTTICHNEYLHFIDSETMYRTRRR